MSLGQGSPTFFPLRAAFTKRKTAESNSCSVTVCIVPPLLNMKGGWKSQVCSASERHVGDACSTIRPDCEILSRDKLTPNSTADLNSGPSYQKPATPQKHNKKPHLDGVLELPIIDGKGTWGCGKATWGPVMTVSFSAPQRPMSSQGWTTKQGSGRDTHVKECPSLSVIELVSKIAMEGDKVRGYQHLGVKWFVHQNLSSNQVQAESGPCHMLDLFLHLWRLWCSLMWWKTRQDKYYRNINDGFNLLWGFAQTLRISPIVIMQLKKKKTSYRVVCFSFEVYSFSAAMNGRGRGVARQFADGVGQVRSRRRF